MRKTKLILFPVFVAALLAGSYWLAFSRQSSAASLPQRPAVDTSIAFWQKRIERNPKAYIEYTYLGEAYTRKARETGDVSDYQRAEAALRQGLAINPSYSPASALLAGVLFSVHDFQGAQDLAKSLKGTKAGTQALAVLGDAGFALGDYSDAEAAYKKLAEVLPGASSYSRMALLADLKGKPDEALEWMQKAAQMAREFGDYPESVAWYEYQVGELYFKTGQVRQARTHYQASLDRFDNYYLALAGLGKTYAAQGSYAKAIAAYQRVVEIIPQPDYLAVLGDLYTITGEPEKARQQYETVEVIGKLAEINQQIFNRQLANFYSDHDIHLAEALKLTLSELEVRKDIYGYDAAAWAAYKNGSIEQAHALITQAMHLGTRDARLYYHAGMIAQAMSQTDEARRLLSEALEINPHFDLLQSRIAQKTLERLGSHDE